jgi:sec-independent protein translocase protein TatB
MFDFSATEFLVIALVALIVIGPRELPGLLRQIGQMVGKVRRMASEFQDQLNTAVESSEIQEIKTEVGKLADEARIDMDYDPTIDTEREIREAVEGKPSDKKAEIHNPDYGNDPDDALVEFPPADSDTASAAKPANKAGDKAEKRAGGSDNAIVREPSKPRAAASGKRLPVNAGNTSTADSVAAKTDNADGKQTSSEG